MEIKVYGEIMSDDEKQFRTMFFDGVKGVTYYDISDAIASRGEGDDDIMLRINCNGGSCVEGFAIYDRLRATEGAAISATVEGECSSMATIVLLAAAADRRRAYANTRFCVHKPRIIDYYTDTMTDSDAQKLADDLRAETDRLMKVYLDRTTADEATLRALMEKDTYITAEEALKLGLISEIIEPVTATRSRMNGIQRAVASLAKAVGLQLSGITEDTVKSFKLNAADGGELEIDIEEGADPHVGDTARPDGEHLMEDGRTIVVTDGTITEIRPAEAPGEAPEEEPEEETAAEADEEMPEETTEEPEPNPLEEENQRLNQRIAELEEENAALTARIAELEGGQPTEEDRAILESVRTNGGMQWLKSVRSTYKPAARTTKSSTEGLSKLQQELAAAGIKSHQTN